MGKHKKKKREDSNGNPKPPKRAKTDKPSRSAKSKKAPPAQPVPAVAPVPVPARAAQQGGGDVDPEAEPQPYQLGDPLPPRIQYKTKPKYWVHNLPDGYESAPSRMVLYSHSGALSAIKHLREEGEPYTTVLKMSDDVQDPPSVATLACTAFRKGHKYVAAITGRKPPEYADLKDLPCPGTGRVTAQEMSKLTSYLKLNGGFTAVQTQELGNCLYASVLRGMSIKEEYTTMHLRRTLVILIYTHRQFFYDYLMEAITKDYGAEKMDAEEYKQKEAEGTLTEQEINDQSLPGPFSLVTYCEHLLKNGTWGDMNTLMLISCLWQVSITSLNAKTLHEVRIRHDMPLREVDIVVIHIGGDHFMGTVRTQFRKGPNGTTSTYHIRQACKDPEFAPNHSLEKEDPNIYLREDREGVELERFWPDIPLPRPKGDSDEEATPRVNPAMLKKALDIHHMYVDYLKGMGVDPCREYNEQSVQYQLEAVLPKQKKCPICGEESYNTGRLKAHIRAQHMEKTPFYCEKCDKYFGDVATLNLHMKKHDKSLFVHDCEKCGKSFTIKSRLTEHMKSHLPGNFDLPCQFCGKVIGEKKNLKKHEAHCKQNKTETKAPRVKCPYCDRDYAQKKDLYRHADSVHEGRDVRGDLKRILQQQKEQEQPPPPPAP